MGWVNCDKHSLKRACQAYPRICVSYRVKFTFRNVVSTRYQDSDFVEMTHQPNYELDVGLLQNKDWMPNLLSSVPGQEFVVKLLF